MIAVTMTHGKSERTTMIEPLVSSAQENPIRIFRRACPESMFAKSRILRLKTRAT